MDSTIPLPPQRPPKTAEELLDDLAWLSRGYADKTHYDPPSALIRMDNELMRLPPDEVVDIALQSSTVMQAHVLIHLNAIVECARKRSIQEDLHSPGQICHGLPPVVRELLPMSLRLEEHIRKMASMEQRKARSKILAEHKATLSIVPPRRKGETA